MGDEFRLPRSMGKFENKQYTLEQVLGFYKSNRIDTDMDYQRGYVWTDSQRQDLIDTLINRGFIPQIHAIKEEGNRVFQIIDGKQRTTTIIRFLTDELEWKRSCARPHFREILFKDKYSLKFSELPENLKIAILDIELNFACHSEMTELSTAILFRKLNNGTALSKFGKWLAGNVYIKNYFLDTLLEHPAALKFIRSPKEANKKRSEEELRNEADEMGVVFTRLFLLMKDHDAGLDPFEKSLEPALMDKRFPPLDELSGETIMSIIKELKEAKEKILNLLDRFNSFGIELYARSGFAYTYALFYTYRHNLTDAEAKELYYTLQNTHTSSVLGSGCAYNSNKLRSYAAFVDDTLKTLRQSHK